MTELNPFRILKNAGANVARGVAAAVVALVLPPLLTRSMTPDAYGSWALVVQFSSYMTYLDFGIQTALGRFVAYANERSENEHRDRIVSTAIAALTLAALLGLILAAVAAILLPVMFRHMPAHLLGQARIAMVLVAGSLAVGLPFSAFNGVFMGMHRYDIPAVTVGGSRIVGAALLVLVVHQGGGLVAMGIAWAGANLLAYVVQYAVYRAFAPDMKLSPNLVTRGAFRELFDYCFSLSIWSFAALLVVGIDLLLVGFFQYREVAYYAVAATLVAFLVGLQTALFSALMSPAAALHARGGSAELGRMLITSTRYGTFLLLLIGFPLILWAPNLLRLWVGAIYAEHATLYLRMLVVANMIRLCGTPYSVLLLGTAQQRLAMVSPIVEGITNLLASLIGGYWFGAVGVAGGTMVGSIVGVLIHFAWNLKRTTDIRISVKEFLRVGLLSPVVCFIPILACAILCSTSLESNLPKLILAPVLLVTMLLAWRCGILESEREWLKSLMLWGAHQ